MEKTSDIIKKIPIALANLGYKEAKLLQNYVSNVVLAILSDTELQDRIKNGEIDKIIQEIKEI